MHGETGNAALPALRLLTQCNGERCTVTEPLSGAVDTIELVDTPLGNGAATAIGSKHGITLAEESSTHTGADLASLGAWMEHSAFAVLNERQNGDEGTVDVLYGIAVGELAGTLPGNLPAGVAVRRGIIVGTPVSGDDRGERLVGDAVLTPDSAFRVGATGPSLHAAFGGIRNIERRTAHGVETVPFENAAAAPDGTFATVPSGARIRGGFHGPRPRGGGGHLQAIRHRRRLRRDAAAGARSVHCRRRRAAETPAAGLIPEYDDTGIGQGYPRMQLLRFGEIIDGARLKTPRAVDRVDQAALPLP